MCGASNYVAKLGTDVLSAETAHARAQRDFLNAVYDERIALATLELATGELAANSQSVVR